MDDNDFIVRLRIHNMPEQSTLKIEDLKKIIAISANVVLKAPSDQDIKERI